MYQIVLAKISNEHLDQFIELYQKHYGETLERDVAYEKASKLLRLVEIVEKGNGLDQCD